MERGMNPRDCLAKNTKYITVNGTREKPRDCLVKKTKHITLTGAREESTGLSGEED